METLRHEELQPRLAARFFPTTSAERLEFAAASDEADLLARLAWQSDEPEVLRAVAANPACPETLRTVAASKANVFEKMALAA